MSTTETENKEKARRIPEETTNEDDLALVDELFVDDYYGVKSISFGAIK